MIRHLLRLAWNRKGKNALLSFELLIAFAVLLVVMTVVIAAGSYVRLPLGFDWRDVIALEIRDDINGDDFFDENQKARVNAMLEALRSVPGVLHVAGVINTPMSSGRNVSGMTGQGGRHLDFDFNEVTDDFREAMDLTLVAGRWFGPGDDASPDRPVVITRRLALAALDDPAPIGRDLQGDAPSDPGQRRLRVVGVVDEFRAGGELSFPRNYLFQRARLDDPMSRPSQSMLIEVDPGQRAGLEKRIEDTARAAAPGWGFSVQPLSTKRAQALRLGLAPVLAVSLVALFLLVMVAMGLAGVFWQSIAQRRSEIGVRRAAGATAGSVVRQIVGEVWAMVSLVVIVGLVLTAQLPLFGVAQWIGMRIFVVAVISSVMFIYLLAGLAALAPATVAARVQPADALRTE